MKVSDKTVRYASWQDDARRKKEAGATVNQLADEYGVTANRIGQIVSPNWKLYCLLGIMARMPGVERKIGNAAKLLRDGGYTFEPTDDLSPARLEANKKHGFKPQAKPEVEMARLREFKSVKKMHDGKALVGAEIICSRCGKTEDYYNYKGSVTPMHLPKEFERRGWLVGNNERTDTCPACLAKLRAPKPTVIKPEGIISIAPKPEGIEAIKPVTQPAMQDNVAKAWSVDPAIDLTKPILEQVTDRKMTRADDQIIYLRLMDVYVDERSGYRDDWTDAKVAADLSVPVEWVSLVRDRSFGPETNAALRDKQNKAMTDKAGEIERLILLADKKMEQLQHLDHKISDMVTQMDGLVKRFDELTTSLETEDKHVENIVAQFDAAMKEYRAMTGEPAAQALAS